MDCFYAAIEVRDRPELRGKPVGVGGARDRRGVLTTCNYEARKFGVRSAMPTFMALQRCPKLIVLPTRFDVYRRESAVIRGILHRFTPLIEPLSLDEAYLDVSAHPGAPGPLAEVIRKLIFRKTKLTASAGIGPNKLVAKIASVLRKPNGQFEVTPDEVPEFMAALPVRKLWGIGAVTERKLAPAWDPDLWRIAALSPVRIAASIRKIRARAFRSLPRNRRSPGRAASRTENRSAPRRLLLSNLETREACEEKLEELYADLMAELAQKEDCIARGDENLHQTASSAISPARPWNARGLLPSLGNFSQLLTKRLAAPARASA